MKKNTDIDITRQMAQSTGATVFLRLNEIKALTGLGKSTIYDAINRGEFPAPVKLGERASGWRLSEYEKWAESPQQWKFHLQITNIEEN